jgi:GDP-L-fucose synthase
VRVSNRIAKEAAMDRRAERILVTGGSGFLGRHVCAELGERGYRQVSAPPHARFDLMKPDQIRALLRAEKPQIVLHLAARVGGIGANRQFPGTYFYQNLAMGLQLIEESRLHGVERFLAVGTICSYPKFTPVPFREEELWNGYPEETNAPYGLAKKMLIAQLQAYRQEFGFDGVNLLLVNLFGPGDNFDERTSHVIPALIRKFVVAREQGLREVEVWGTGNASREFMYVADAARAIALAMEKLNTSDPVNVGTGREISIRDLANLLAMKTGFRGTVRFNANQPDGQPRRCLDVTRARDLLGFQASTSLEDGLERTIAWFRSQQLPLRLTA